MYRDLIIYTPMYVTFFWAVVLLTTTSKNNRAKYFLGIFMVAAFFVYLSHAVFFNQNHSAYIFFDPVYTFASLSVYPLYYLYIKLLTIETEYKWRNLRLLIPAMLLSVISATIYLIMSPAEREMYLTEFLLREGNTGVYPLLLQLQKGVFILSRLVFTVQVILFLVLGRKLVIRYNKHVANFYSNLESKTIVWVNLLLYSFVITSVMSIVFNVLGRSVFLNSVSLLLIPSLIFSVLLFFIGLQGYMQNHTVVNLIEDAKQQPEKNLKEYNQNQLKEKLMELFVVEKIYRNSDLKITQISMKLQTNRTYVSQLINNEFNCSFSEFANEYRVIEAKKLLVDQTYKNYSLDYISETVGFGSLNTFMRVFKELEGITPGRFRDDNKVVKQGERLLPL
ncbi:MAG TPA: helix-turn-helix domain-containing protein [Draconibacterium sp.]|nr:helix-turn-helix domain-containing protein [Draconibacterium sp.]